MKIVFMGTPDFATGILDAILKANKEVVGIVTTPDKPAGRGQKIAKSSVKCYAESLDIPLLQPEKLKDDAFIQQLKELNADLFIVVAFRMLPEVIWSMPPKGTINLHASILPQYRGAAPINWAIINGETTTGVTTFFIEKEIDTGLILLKEKVEILPDMNAGELHDSLLDAGKRTMLKSIQEIEASSFTAQPQITEKNGELKPAPKIFKHDCKINWNQPSETIHNFIRGLSPYPTAWSNLHFENSNKTISIKIYRSRIAVESGQKLAPGHILLTKNTLYVGTTNYPLEILEIQPEGKRKMEIKDFVQGYQKEQLRFI